jgi:hypothetical protein
MTQSPLAIRTCDGPSARWPWRMGGPAASPFQEACTSVETRKLIAIEYRVVLTLVSSTSPLINGWSARLDVRSKKFLSFPIFPNAHPKKVIRLRCVRKVPSPVAMRIGLISALQLPQRSGMRTRGLRGPTDHGPICPLPTHCGTRTHLHWERLTLAAADGL